MSILDRNSLLAQVASEFANNSTRNITPTKLRTVINNIIDSFYNKVSDEIEQADPYTQTVVPAENFDQYEVGRLFLNDAVPQTEVRKLYHKMEQLYVDANTDETLVFHAIKLSGFTNKFVQIMADELMGTPRLRLIEFTAPNTFSVLDSQSHTGGQVKQAKLVELSSGVLASVVVGHDNTIYVQPFTTDGSTISIGTINDANTADFDYEITVGSVSADMIVVGGCNINSSGAGTLCVIAFKIEANAVTLVGSVQPVGSRYSSELEGVTKTIALPAKCFDNYKTVVGYSESMENGQAKFVMVQVDSGTGAFTPGTPYDSSLVETTSIELVYCAASNDVVAIIHHAFDPTGLAEIVVMPVNSGDTSIGDTASPYQQEVLGVEAGYCKNCVAVELDTERVFVVGGDSAGVISFNNDSLAFVVKPTWQKIWTHYKNIRQGFPLVLEQGVSWCVVSVCDNLNQFIARLGKYNTEDVEVIDFDDRFTKSLCLLTEAATAPTPVVVMMQGGLFTNEGGGDQPGTKYVVMSNNTPVALADYLGAAGVDYPSEKPIFMKNLISTKTQIL
ncbi:MAG: hypothetical protein AB7G44_04985 [Bacteroidia bacterium]